MITDYIIAQIFFYATFDLFRLRIFQEFAYNFFEKVLKYIILEKIIGCFDRG